VATLVVSGVASDSFDEYFQRKMFVRGGKYYIFWSQDQGAYNAVMYKYASTINGLATASSTELLNAGINSTGRNFEVALDENNDRVGILYRKEIAGFAYPYFVYCTFNGDGSLTTATEHYPTWFGGYKNARNMLDVRSDGIWVGVSHAAANTVMKVLLSRTPTPTGVTDWSEGLTLYGNIDWSDNSRVARDDLTASGLIHIFVRSDNGLLCASLWNRSSGWGNIVSGTLRPSGTNPGDSMSAPYTDANGDPHVVVVETGTKKLWECVYDTSEGTWSSGVIDSPASGYLDPTLTEYNDDLYLFARRGVNPNSTFVTYKKSGGSWSATYPSGDAFSSEYDFARTPVAPYGGDTQFIGWMSATNSGIYVSDYQLPVYSTIMEEPFFSTRGYGESVSSPSGVLQFATLGLGDAYTTAQNPFSLYSMGNKALLPISMEIGNPIVMRNGITNLGGYVVAMVSRSLSDKMPLDTILNFIMEVPTSSDGYFSQTLGSVSADKYGKIRGRISFNFQATPSDLNTGSVGYAYVWGENSQYVTPRLKVPYVVK
jgi:hypothetical protein